MVKCQLTGKVIGPNVIPVKLVVETRQKKYTNTYGKKTVESTGWEIVKEILVSREAAETYKENE